MDLSGRIGKLKWWNKVKLRLFI